MPTDPTHERVLVIEISWGCGTNTHQLVNLTQLRAFIAANPRTTAQALLYYIQQGLDDEENTVLLKEFDIQSWGDALATSYHHQQDFLKEDLPATVTSVVYLVHEE